MAKGQKRVSAKSRSEEIARALYLPDQQALVECGEVQFKIELPKHYRICHLFDGSIATTIYLRPRGVQGRNGKDAANKASDIKMSG
jgi:hypothetical protein